MPFAPGAAAPIRTFGHCVSFIKSAKLWTYRAPVCAARSGIGLRSDCACSFLIWRTAGPQGAPYPTCRPWHQTPRITGVP